MVDEKYILFLVKNKYLPPARIAKQAFFTGVCHSVTDQRGRWPAPKVNHLLPPLPGQGQRSQHLPPLPESKVTTPNQGQRSHQPPLGQRSQHLPPSQGQRSQHLPPGQGQRSQHTPPQPGSKVTTPPPGQGQRSQHTPQPGSKVTTPPPWSKVTTPPINTMRRRAVRI